MTCIHDNEVNNIAEYNLIHDILDLHKCTKIQYSPILHGFITTRKGIAKFNYFRILLDSRCSSTVVIVRLVKNLSPRKYAVIQWHTLAVNITNNLKVEEDFTLLDISATNVLTWKCHVDDSSKGKYNMILGRYLLSEL